MRISLQDARRLAVSAQRLAMPRPRATRAAILRLIRELGYLQLDPTNVVARNPYLVLWSRVGDFDTTVLDSLLEHDHALFETPSFLLPVSDLPLHAATLSRYRSDVSPGGPHSVDTYRSRARDWLSRNQKLRRDVLARLRREGPLPLTAFEGRTHVSWTTGDIDSDRNVSVMLAILQRQGTVVVAGRRRGHKLYALADGWLPKVTPLAPRERARVATLRALDANGVATLKQLRWYAPFNRHITVDGVRELEDEGEIVALEVEGIGETFFAPRGALRRLASFTPRTALLSPFDPLIKDRERLEMLFGYRYRIEIYTPVRLRKLGFWAMPVLYGDRIIGSVDPKADRERGVLVVNKVVTEKGASMRAIKDATGELAEFVGAKKVEWPR